MLKRQMSYNQMQTKKCRWVWPFDAGNRLCVSPVSSTPDSYSHDMLMLTCACVVADGVVALWLRNSKLKYRWWNSQEDKIRAGSSQSHQTTKRMLKGFSESTHIAHTHTHAIWIQCETLCEFMHLCTLDTSPMPMAKKTFNPWQMLCQKNIYICTIRSTYAV